MKMTRNGTICVHLTDCNLIRFRLFKGKNKTPSKTDIRKNEQKGFLKKVEISMKRCQRINSSFLNITMSEFSQRKRNVNESNTELKIDTITANQKKSSLWKISRGKKVVL